jgi:hydroxylamine reductase
MKEENVIGALIGLAGACNNNPKTAHTDALVLAALALPIRHPDASAEEWQEMLDAIHAEKHTISPNCAVCTMPCGNTSDYDMSRLQQVSDAVCTAKLDTIAALEQYAAKHCEAGDTSFSEEAWTLVHKAISYLGYDLQPESYHDLLKELNA